MPEQRSYYQVLQIDPSASAEVIQGAYRALLKNARVHPDLGGSAPEAQAINEAYSVLSHPQQRQDYDRRLAIAASRATRSFRDAQAAEPGPEVRTVLRTQYILICPACRKRNVVPPQEALEAFRCQACGALLLPVKRAPAETDHRRAFRLGMLLYEKRIFDRARRELEAAVRLKPGHAAYHFWLGRTLYESGLPERARPKFQTAAQLRPAQFQIQFWLGQSNYRLKAFGPAITAFRAAANLRPEHSDTWLRLGSCHYRLQEFDEAVAALGKAQALDLRRPEPHLLLGIVELSRQNLQQAVRAFQSAARLKPDDPLPRRYLELCLSPPDAAGGAAALRRWWNRVRQVAAG